MTCRRKVNPIEISKENILGTYRVGMILPVDLIQKFWNGEEKSLKYSITIQKLHVTPLPTPPPSPMVNAAAATAAANLALYSAGDHYPDFKDLFDADKSKK